MHIDRCSIGIAALLAAICKPQHQLNKGDVMDCHAIEENTNLVNLSLLSFVSGVTGWAYGKIFHPSRLDLDGIPDRVKRDLGFLDGRDPRYESDLCR